MPSAYQRFPSMVMFEAEDFAFKKWPWQVFNDGNASGGQFIKAPNGTGTFYKTPPSGNYVKYNFTVDEAGEYRLDGLVKAPNNSDNSVWVKIDDGSWMNGHRHAPPAGLPSWPVPAPLRN